MDEDSESPKIIACPYCGRQIPETTDFCWFCGRQLIARPERPEFEPSKKVSSKMNLVILLVLIVSLGLVIWSIYFK